MPGIPGVSSFTVWRTCAGKLPASAADAGTLPDAAVEPADAASDALAQITALGEVATVLGGLQRVLRRVDDARQRRLQRIYDGLARLRDRDRDPDYLESKVVNLL